jgi:hypothetical protein
MMKVWFPEPQHCNAEPKKGQNLSLGAFAASRRFQD